MKLFVATQNVVAHRDLDRGRRDEQAMTVAELKRTIGEKAKVEEELEQTRSQLEEEEKRNAELSASLGKLQDVERLPKNNANNYKKNL